MVDKKKMLSTNNHWIPVLLLLVFGLHYHASWGAELNHRLELHKKLFNENNYSGDVIPILDQSDVLRVSFAFEIVKIVEVNAKGQSVVVYGWIEQQWVSPMLVWNATQFGGIEYLHVPAKTVWVPDILLYNNIDSQENLADVRSTYRSDVLLRSNGTAFWKNQVMLKSICRIEVTFFPFDNQTCQLKFGSWMYDSNTLDIQPVKNQKFPTESFQYNDEWDIYKVRMRRNEQRYQCCVTSFVDVTVTIEMGRDSMDYFITLIVPCCLISSMIFLGFVLPPETGERIGLSITVLLAMTVFQQLTSEVVPSYNFPILAQYYFAIILEIGASVVVTTMILNFYHRTNKKMPCWLKRLVIKWIATVVFLRNTPEQRNVTRRKSHRESKRKRKEKLSRHGSRRKAEYRDHNSQGFSVTFGDTVYCSPENPEPLNMEMQNMTSPNSFLPNGYAFSPMNNNTQGDQIVEEARPYVDDRDNLSEDERVIRHLEWTLVARILDRLFLVVAIICGIVTVSAIFLRAPKLWSDYKKLTLENAENIVEK